MSYVNRTADENGNVTASTATQDCTAITDNSTSWAEGWYSVNSDVTIGSRVTVTGAVNLILCDNVTLTVNGGIQLTGENSLTIYGQTGDTGTLKVSGAAQANAGIGGNQEQALGTLTINGGTVNATGGDGGTGIGGGMQGAGGTITLGYSSAGDSIKASSYNGTVTIEDAKPSRTTRHNTVGASVMYPPLPERLSNRFSIP